MVSSMVSENNCFSVHINLETGDGVCASLIGQEAPRDFEDTFSNFSQAI